MKNELFIGREVILWRTGDYLLGIATPLSRHLNGFDLSITWRITFYWYAKDKQLGINLGPVILTALT